MAATAKPLTKSQLVTALSEKLDMSKKEVSAHNGVRPPLLTRQRLGSE